MDLTNRLAVTANTAHFSHDCFTSMRRIMHIKKIPANGLVFFEGDHMDKLFFVLEGTVKLTKLNEDGKNLVFHYFFPDDLFGEFNPRQELRSMFTARVVEDSVIGVMQKDDLEALLVQNDDLAMAFSQWQSQIQRYTQLKLRDLLFHGKDGALASALLRTVNTYGLQDGNNLVITRKFINNDFAEMVGASRETINRLLTVFKKNDIISYQNGHMEILDLAALKSLCHCEECPVTICRL